MLSGSCNCGDVRFEVMSGPKDVYVCHCSICRKATGSNGVAVIIVKNEALRWQKGEGLVRTWRKPGHDWQTWYCGVCGSSLPGKNDDAHMFVPAGLIDQGGDALKVAHHIWVGSKAGWGEIAGDACQHQKGFNQQDG